MSRAPRPFKARPRDPITGRQIRVSATTQRELDARLHRLDALRIDLRDGELTPEQAERRVRRLQHGPVTLERAARAYVARADLAPNTIRRTRSFMHRAAGALLEKEIYALDGPELAKWIESLRARGLAASSIRTEWQTLLAIFAYASERGWIGAVPWGAWRPKLGAAKGSGEHREAARDVRELLALLDAARQLDQENRDEPRRFAPFLECKIAVAVGFGLRQGELAGLRWPDFDEETCALTIARQYDGERLPKGREIRTLLGAPELGAFLLAHRAELDAMELFAWGGPIFPSPASTSDRPRHFVDGSTPCLDPDDVRDAARRARLPNPDRWVTHSLRDTFATLEHAAHGSNLRTLAERTRHKSIPALARYLHARGRAPAPPGFRFALSPTPPFLPE